VLHWANCCKSQCAMLSQLLWIKECYSESVVVNHVVLFWTSGCELCCSPWFITTGSAYLIMVHNQWHRITHHDSETLAQNSPTWFTTTGSAVILSQWLLFGVLSWAIGCDSWWAMLSQWLWIIVFFSEPVVVNHGEICLATHNTARFTTTGSV
jgi:hypothetical protein